MLSEFELIERYFTRPAAAGAATLGIGDDCALLAPAPGRSLAISTDMLVEGRHFLAACDPRQLGHKALAVNLSDLAAMGAQPLAFTLALAMPKADEAWLAPFAQGLFELADQHHCALIGGDTTRGPLTICITVFGELLPDQALRRDGARAGDDIWVSGTLGDAALALIGQTDDIALDAAGQHEAEQRLHTPTPRVALGLALAGVAHAAIDISDGLAGDLTHILQRSAVGAQLDVDALPPGPVLQRQPHALRQRLMLAGGDDYELCFTAAADARSAVLAAAQRTDTIVTRIGSIETEPGLRLTNRHGTPLTLAVTSFDHFRTP